MRLFLLNSYYKQISVRQVIKKGLKTKISMFVAETPLKCWFSKEYVLKCLYLNVVVVASHVALHVTSICTYISSPLKKHTFRNQSCTSFEPQFYEYYFVSLSCYIN
jgi:hypothetical protein